ncbi:MAG: methyltransferase domain-containing protein [Burkholderiales bacterium]
MPMQLKPAPSTCPVCGSFDHEMLFPRYQGKSITSDLAVLADAELDNRCCKACGLIFNARGTRGFTEDFYRDSYSLMMRKESAAIQSFSGVKPISQAEKSLHVLLEMAPLGPSGHVLEVGAGKGEFLVHFTKTLPGWTVTAFEPSEAFSVLQSRLPAAQIMRGGYKDFPGPEQLSDLVVALGVLEHVENPLDMMQWGWRQLKDGGIFFIRVPNFANNPNDSFCADHLSKLTVATLEGIATAAGFEIISFKEAGVPVFCALRKLAVQGLNAVPNAFASNVTIARANVATAKASIEAVLAARNKAHETGERFAIFGLGSSGLFAPFYFDFPPDQITAYIDENKTMWGSEVHGRPVGGLECINEMEIKHIALAISPVYVAKVTQKLTPFGVSIYAP